MARMQLKWKRLFRRYTFNIPALLHDKFSSGDTLSIRVVVLLVSHLSPLIKDQIQRSNEEIFIMKATSVKVKRKQNTEDLALDYGYYLKASTTNMQITQNLLLNETVFVIQWYGNEWLCI